MVYKLVPWTQGGRALGRLTRPAFPLMFRRASVRRFFLRGMAVHGDRLTPSQAVEIVNDALAGAILDDLSADEWHIAPLDTSPVPNHCRMVGERRGASASGLRPRTSGAPAPGDI